jgi:hypothetical protein
VWRQPGSIKSEEGPTSGEHRTEQTLPAHKKTSRRRLQTALTHSTIRVYWMVEDRRHVFAVLAGCAAALLGGAIWLHATGLGSYVGFDFANYLEAARAVANGENPYHQLATRVSNNGPASGYVYPPLLAVVLSVPVRFGLDGHLIALMWDMLTLAAVVWMGRELNVGLRGRTDWAGSLIFATACLVPSLAMFDLFLGQADLLLAALVVISCGLWLRRNPWAALVLGLAIAVKWNLAIILLVWLWKSDWRSSLRALVAVVLLVVIPFTFVGLDGVRDYLRFMTHWSGLGGNADVMNQAPYGQLLRTFTVSTYTEPLLNAPWLIAPLRFVATIFLALCWLSVTPRARSNSTISRGMAECLLALPLAVLLSPYAENIHYCIVLPTLVGLSWFASQRSLWRHPAAWALWSTALVACLPRIEDTIYPSHVVTLPGQADPTWGPIIILLRTGMVLWIGLIVFLAGRQVLVASDGTTQSRKESQHLLALSS